MSAATITDHPHLTAMRTHPLHRAMGLVVHEASGGRSRLGFTVAEAMLTAGAALHAGYLYTACDLAAYAAVLSELSAEEWAVTHDLHISVMRSARAGEEVIVRAGVVKLGGRIVFLDAEARAGERLLATARITKSILGREIGVAGAAAPRRET